MMLRHKLSDNPDKLYLIRSQADEWAIRVARRIMYRKITHFDLNAEPLLSEWKHLLRGGHVQSGSARAMTRMNGSRLKWRPNEKGEEI